MIAAVVPVKRLGGGKSRLRPGLADEHIEQLTLAMLEDVVAALRASPEIGPVVVVTEDERIARAARGWGARADVRAEPGLNPSIEATGEALAAEGARALLVVLADVPGIVPADVRCVVEAQEALGHRGIVVVPSRDGGTAALLRAPHDVIPAAFGPDSAARHCALARERGVPLRELPLPGCATDLDYPEDLDVFLSGPGGGPRTRALLARVGRKAAP